MPDGQFNVNELKQQILRAVERQIDSVGSRRAIEVGPQSAAPFNPLAASIEQGFDGVFATGYDSGTGETVVPFMVGISIVGGPDLVVGD